MIVIHPAIFKDRVEEAASLLNEVIILPDGRMTLEQIENIPKNAFCFVPLNAARKLSASQVAYHPTAYSVSSWISDYADFVLNDDIIWLTWSELKRRYKDFIKKPTFIRPDSGNKLFTGQVIDQHNAEFELNFLEKYSSITDRDFVCLSSAKPVSNEYRVWIGKNGIITGSPYSFDDVASPPTDDLLIFIDNFVDYVIQDDIWKPDDMFVADFCLSDNLPKLVEINAFSCSGVYNADLKAIFDCVRENYEKLY